MRRVLTDGGPGTEFWEAFETFQLSAWRWEQQPVYEITDEHASIEAFLAGRPSDPMKDPYLSPWMHQVAEQTAAGKPIGRVRVLEEPPTDYQRWELWLDAWNTAAGEKIQYLTRTQARGLAERAPFGDTDWWLFDSARVVIMHFDSDGRRIKVELTDDPEDVAAASAFQRDAMTLADKNHQNTIQAA
ncbi:DUF6879 family protein [Paractinoplanes atraurantiacus]|uniref:DUF6879 domain-containing protein n=1 Tax=Paractinoplanes atraurantiacus TaxID=1036182 RepID=A0A285KJL3_9ACTN|nr:DUF6879 family protein [Actinoplanes atraurantiacus]SNY72790.1 hypothetical protein SAMN05421748_14415 [Actinoplanes atraurantiacus]